ncbi:unnamed protein product [Clonostachys byssicola]|uniref:Major facilitator superfamily (MFS) profile domain-containing protein n=1 Tax=Clonostachys byssicola TaxID=160290 RepID=A0A9N9U7N1_9HYPO|nr:unnamed protein product [Clonostachys byssicola]
MTDSIAAPTDKQPVLAVEAKREDGGKSSDDVETAVSQPEEDEQPRFSVFTLWQKRAIVCCAALTAFFSPMTAQIYLPALTSIAEDLQVSSAKVNLTITTYMIFQGVVPMFVGSLADGWGRRPAYIICFVVYIAANIGLALAPSYGAVLGLRCVQSAGSSPTVALCSAVVADVATSAERGSYIAFTVLPIVLAPSLGPIIGGLLTQYLGWRSIFWFCAILAGVTFLLLLAFFPETCRTIVGDGSIPAPVTHRTLWQLFQKSMKKRTEKNDESDPGPLPKGPKKPKLKLEMPNFLGSLMMLTEKETCLLVVSSSICLGGFYGISAALPTQLTNDYGLNQTEVGLMFLPIAVASFITGAIAGRLMQWRYRHYCDKTGVPFDRTRQIDLSNFPIERARLDVGTPLLAVAGLGVISWGWAIQARAHLAVLCFLMVVMGLGMVGYNNTSNTLLVDVQPGRPGTVTAAGNFVRCLLGAGFSAAVIPMIEAIGAGWTFTIFGALYLVFTPFLFLVRARGIKWRAELRMKIEKKKEAEEVSSPSS